MKQIRKLYLLFGLLLPFWASAQDTFTLADSAFFAKQQADMESSLSQVGIVFPKIRGVRIQTVPTHVVLRLQVHSLNTWFGLRDSYLEKNRRSLEQDIFEKFVFLCEVDGKQALLVVEESEPLYKITAGLDPAHNYTFSIEENKTRAARVEKFSLPTARVIPTTSVAFDDFGIVREKIINILTNFYKDKGTWFESSRLDSTGTRESRVKLRITNIKKEMFYDSFFGYFELISLEINLKKINKVIEYECVVNGKYGTSIITAPRLNDYKDMGKDYQSYIDAYALKISDLLYKKLNNR